MTYSYTEFLISNIKGTDNKIVFNAFNSILMMKLENIVYEKPRIVEKDSRIKNLILYQIESLENWAVTPTSMPFLYNLTHRYLTYNNISPVKYAAWTSGAVLLTQCGVPQLVVEYEWFSRQYDSIGIFSSISCISDYLASEGYEKLHYVANPDNINGMDSWKNGKNYSRKLNAKDDLQLTNELIDKFLPEYNVKGENERYVTWIMNADTHGPYHPPGWCKPRNLDESKMRQQHNCFDMKLEEFVNKFFELKMDRHTVLIIYPDHPIMVRTIPEPRRLFVLFPGREGGINDKKMTYYDFAPTVMDSIGMKKIFPGFPFGKSAFSNEIGSAPNDDDLILMFQFFSQSLNINRGKEIDEKVTDQLKNSKNVIELGH